MDREAGERLPERFAALTGGVIVSFWQLQARDLLPVGEFISNAPVEAIDLYQRQYHQHDPWAKAVHETRFNAVLRGGEILDDTALARSVYYNEFAIIHEMFHMIGAIVPIGVGAASTVGAVSILRRRGSEAFDDLAVAALGRAVPHIKGAFRLRGQFDDAAAKLQDAALDATLEGFGAPALVLDGHGAVVRANTAAAAVGCIRQALARRTNPHGVLRLPAGPGHERLGVFVAAAARGEAGGAFRLVDGARAYVATVTPLTGRLAELAGAYGRVLLVLRPMEPDGAGLMALAAGLFGLTEAEAEVAAGLAAGHSPAEIATARRVKVSTVRTLLQRACDKTESRNLRDLVRVLTSLR